MAPCSPALAPSSPGLEEALHRRNQMLRAQLGSKRLLVNLPLALAALLDANHQLVLRLLLGSPPLLLAWLLYTAEMLLFAVAVTNVLHSLWTMVSPLHGLAPLALTDRQYRLLRLPPDSPGFTKSPERKGASYPNPFTPLPGPLLSSPSSPASNLTPVNLSAASWTASPSSPPAANLRRDHFPDSPSVTDSASLAQYLADYRTWEQTHLASNTTLDDSGSQASQSVLLWRAGPASLASPPGGGRIDFSPGPGTGPGHQLYQLSFPSPPAASATAAGEQETKADRAKASVLSQRLGIDPLELVGWNENLRVWLTQTVLRPLITEVDSVNLALPKHGVADCQVGQVAVERLRKVSGLPAVAQHLPHLAAILPYLEAGPDQPYLLGRLRQLARTGALSLYRWSGGGEGWTERLPSDSELLLHCLACYLDSRLLTSASMRLAGTSNPQAEAMKPFTGVAFFRHGEKPDLAKDPDVLAIVQVGRSPAHYVVQVGGSQLDVGCGRNNLIHTILLFLHRVKQDRHGMLGRVNLGLSGLNILWVLD